jgi:outer membrane protein OmpA-like peptidoglycan-associated protein
MAGHHHGGAEAHGHAHDHGNEQERETSAWQWVVLTGLMVAALIWAWSLARKAEPTANPVPVVHEHHEEAHAEAPPAPPPEPVFFAGVRSAVSGLSLPWLSVALQDRLATLSGTAPDQAAKDAALIAAETAIRAVPEVPADLLVIDAIAVEGGAAGVGSALAELSTGTTLEACQTAFTETMAGRAIGFELGQAAITPDSARLLDALTGAAVLCAAFPIEIAGHTDIQGDAARNQTLSEARAVAVRDYLAAKGVDPMRLTPVGYGSTQPLVPGDTPEAHAANRRIAFSLSAAPVVEAAPAPAPVEGHGAGGHEG